MSWWMITSDYPIVSMWVCVCVVLCVCFWVEVAISFWTDKIYIFIVFVELRTSIHLCEFCSTMWIYWHKSITRYYSCQFPFYMGRWMIGDSPHTHSSILIQSESQVKNTRTLFDVCVVCNLGWPIGVFRANKLLADHHWLEAQYIYIFMIKWEIWIQKNIYCQCKRFQINIHLDSVVK